MALEADNKFKQHQSLTIHGPKFGQACQKLLLRRETQQWAVEEPKLDNDRKLRGIYFINPEDMEFRDTMKDMRKKLEVPLLSAEALRSDSWGHHNDLGIFS